jgi:DNA-binding transcriptional regulator YiaG
MKPSQIKQIRGTLTQSEFAELIGTSPCLVSRWERGKHQPSRYYCSRMLHARKEQAHKEIARALETLRAIEAGYGL